MKVYEVRWEGTGNGMLCHNGELADPLNAIAKDMKRVSAVKKKTDEHHMQLQELEWFGGLYLDEQGRPIVPSMNIEATLLAAAKKLRMGDPVKSGIICLDNPLIQHDGPKNATAKELWALSLKQNHRYRHRGPARVQQSRIMRTRPWFRVWALDFRLEVDPELLEQSHVEQILAIAQRVGINDWRPKFGRFKSTTKGVSEQ